jgi:K+-sensing histidine kinase KdpD
VGITRLGEFKENRFEWIEIPSSVVKEKIVSFLRVIENVSRYRSRFVYSPQEHGDSDYLITLDIAENPGNLYSPRIIHDIARDLIANSRKYSPIGSRINVQLTQIEDNGIKLVISDEGMGIPVDELISVVKFKHRGSNVQAIRTMGEGFGLTKAYHICKLFNGKFVIESAVDQGTTIELTMYPPPKDQNTEEAGEQWIESRLTD